MDEAAVVVAGRRYLVPAGDRFTFGRSRNCTACLDPIDTTISRYAGSLGWRQGTWWLANESRTWPLSVIDDVGFRSVLAPGRRAAVESATQVVVSGARGEHTLRIEVAVARVDAAPPAPADGVPTAVGETVLVSPADRLALLAMFDGYLHDPPRYQPHPRTYAAAAKRLGWERTTLVKRIEYLRTRLTSAGVPRLTGWNALSNLAEYALSRGLITRADLSMLYRDGGAG